jgi:exodeoxyribonuclease-3
LRALIREQNPDILCLQEVRAESLPLWLDALFPHKLLACADRKGYSGVALLSKESPLSWNTPAFPTSAHGFQCEGRVVTAEFADMFVVTVYTPNAQADLKRLAERLEWERMLRAYLGDLKTRRKAVILCGDLNCAFSPTLDIANQKPKAGTPGLSVEERREFAAMLDAGFVDSFRFLHPSVAKYSFWSAFANSRQRGVGWRLDYFIVSKEDCEKIRGAECLTEYWGSDHGPVLLDFGCSGCPCCPAK